MDFMIACTNCRHFDRTDLTQEVCTAFPKGIPAKILNGESDHRQPIEGDHGIQWAPIDAPKEHV